MAELCQHYRINEENLNLWKQFIRLSADDIEILRQLAPWAEERASQIAKEFYDHQLASPRRAPSSKSSPNNAD